MSPEFRAIRRRDRARELRKTLTVLYGIELPDDEEDDEQTLIQSYTPRFRRR